MTDSYRWRGAAPPEEDDEDEDEDEASPVVPLPLDDRAPKQAPTQASTHPDPDPDPDPGPNLTQEPHGGMLNGRYLDVEGAYWARTELSVQVHD